MKNSLIINKKELNKIIIPLVNLFFAVFLWGIVQCKLGAMGIVLCCILCGIYLLFYFSLNLHDSVVSFYYNMLYMYFVITMTYRKLIGINAINWLNFINVVLIVLLIKILFSRLFSCKRYKDPILFIYLLFIVVFSVVSLLNGTDIINVIGVDFIYIRVIPIYLIVAYNNKFFSKFDIVLFLIQCAIPTPILLWKYSVDDFGGIFGVYGVTPFSLITIFLFGIVIGYYINEKISFSKFIFLNFVFYLFWILGEVKFAILMVPILEIILLLIKNKNVQHRIKNLYKKIKALVFIPLISVAGFFVFLFFNEKWKDRIARVGLMDYIVYYATSATNHSEMSKFEVIIYSFNNILTSIPKKLFGLGIGSAMPPETCLFEFRDQLLGRNNEYISFYATELYNQYSYKLGYHNTGFGTVFLESGILGILCFAIIFSIIAFKAWKLIKSKNAFHSIVGYGGLIFIIYLIPIFVYYNFIVRIRMYATIMILFGIITRYYRLEKNNRGCVD